MIKPFVIAIDGPSASGKGVTSRRLAQMLGLLTVDTGAMYRALTWLALERGVSLDDGAALGGLAEESGVDFADGGRVLIAGHDVTSEIRDARVDKVVSTVAAHPEVRTVMRDRQQQLAAPPGGSPCDRGRTARFRARQP